MTLFPLRTYALKILQTLAERYLVIMHSADERGGGTIHTEEVSGYLGESEMIEKRGCDIRRVLELSCLS